MSSAGQCDPDILERTKQSLLSKLRDVDDGTSGHDDDDGDEDSISSYFECPVCKEDMRGTTQIWACSRDHWLCRKCTAEVETQS